MSSSQSSGPFRVLGADSKSGRDLVIEVDASTPAEASAFANRMGLLVSSVERKGDVADPAITPSHQQTACGCRCCGRTQLVRDRVYLFGGASAVCGLVSQAVGAIVFLLAIAVTLNAASAVDPRGPTLDAHFVAILWTLAGSWSAFAVGFLLAAPKKVWRCASCSAVVSERV